MKAMGVGAFACFLLPLMAAHTGEVQAPQNQTQAKRQKGAQFVRQACGKGIELRLSAASATQGSLLLVEVRSAAPLEVVKGEWDGHAIPFWQETREQSSKERPAWVYRAFLGVDLERPEGRYEFSSVAEGQSGEPVSCKAAVTVKAGRFATERLRVGKEYVEPSPEQLARAEEERQRLRAIFSSATPEKLWTGRFRKPLAGVNTASNFGRRRILNGQPGSPHGGADLPAATGTPVLAAQRGHVVLADDLFFSGNTVVVDHGLGIYTFYGHLESISVHVGEVVEAGGELGKVGATGRVTGPHLHWGLTVNQARVNPLEMVRLSGWR